MTATISASELQQVVAALGDVTAALSADLENLPADQKVVLDAVQIAAMIDPALAPLVVIEPLAAAIVAWVVANNKQGEPGSQTPSISSKKGSDPWQT